jgi:hypothetical protein
VTERPYSRQGINCLADIGARAATHAGEDNLYQVIGNREALIIEEERREKTSPLGGVSAESEVLK